MNKTIMIDVDGPLFRLDKRWYHWLCDMTGVRLSTPPWEMKGGANYDFTEYFKEALFHEGLTGFEMFRWKTLYDSGVDIVEGSVEALKALSWRGYTLLPVSRVFYSHADSKQALLDKHYPMLEPMIPVNHEKSSSKKSWIKADYVIEDRFSELVHFSTPTKGIVFNTPYINPQPLDIPYVVVDTWSDILKYFEEESNG